jgi:hypothetical protein
MERVSARAASCTICGSACHELLSHEEGRTRVRLCSTSELPCPRKATTCRACCRGGVCS